MQKPELFILKNSSVVLALDYVYEIYKYNLIIKTSEYLLIICSLFGRKNLFGHIRVNCIERCCIEKMKKYQITNNHKSRI